MSTGRDSLKSNFKAGSLPTEDDFSHLIDSMLHMEDEGFSKSPEYGLKISSAPNQGTLLTFFPQGGGRQTVMESPARQNWRSAEYPHLGWR